MSGSAPAYVVVLNAKPRFLPRWLRARLGELYMAVNVVPYWVPHPIGARHFESWAAAHAYVQRGDGSTPNGMENAVVRRSPLKRAPATLEQP